MSERTFRHGLFLRVDPPGPGEFESEDFDGSDRHWFFRVLAWTEMSAHHDEIDGCAACRSVEIPRKPFAAPHQFGVMTTAEGIRYGYALCAPCKARMEANRESVIAVIDGNFGGSGVA